jgi:O-antigen/teichoic acid export membrane protein
MFLKISRYINNFLGQGHNRTLLIKKNLLSSFVLKGFSVALSFILIPLTINYVNVTQYGIWLTLSSVIYWFAYFDLGLGSGLRNKLTESNALGKVNDAKTYVSTTYAVLSIISGSTFILFLIFNRFINWNKILNISSQQAGNLNQLFLIILGLFCLQFVVQLIMTVFTALHALSRVALVAFMSQVIVFLATFILIQFTKGHLIYLAFVFGGAPIFVQLVASIYFYRKEYRSIAPNFKYINFKNYRGLLTLGGAFFIINMGQLILYETDNIVISNMFGPTEVTTFNISYKLFSVVLIISGTLLGPFWSAFTDAYTKKDFTWIKQVFNKLQKMWLLLALGAFLLLLLSPLITRIWLGNKVKVPILLSVLMCFNIVTNCLNGLCSFLLNGLNKVRLQMYSLFVCFIINIPLAIVLGRLIGIAGVVASNFICMASMTVLYYIQCIKLINQKAKGIWDK